MVRGLLSLLGIFGATSSVQGADIAILANINSNLPALRAVLADAKNRNVENFVIIGDMCGVGSEPNECIDEVMKLKRIATVPGAWDLHASGIADLGSPDPDYQWVASWLRKTVTEEHKKWISALKISESSEGFCVTYGRFDAPNQLRFPKIVTDVRASMDALSTSGKILGFTGATGVPVAYYNDNPITFTQTSPFKLNTGLLAIVNAGSVGGPKDDNPYSSYLIMHEDKISVVRVKYDIDMEAAAMKSIGFPLALIDKLKHGR